MTTQLIQSAFLLRCLDQRMTQEIRLHKMKSILGSSESVDVILSDPSISSVHAFIFINGNEGLIVKDLCSEAGVFVNGKKVSESFVGAGDVLTIGTLSFSVDCYLDDSPLHNPDSAIELISKGDHFVELPQTEGLFYIDGDYCDIKFDDSLFRPVQSLPNFSGPKDFIDLDEKDKSLDLVNSVQKKRLEIISYSGGLISDVSYLELKNGDYFLDPEGKGHFNILFHSIHRLKVFTVQKGDIRFHDLSTSGMTVMGDASVLNSPLILTFGMEQLSLRIVETKFKWKGIPLFFRDRDFFKQSGKIFASLFLPFLFLLMIDLPKMVNEEVELAVVYKLPQPEVLKQVSQESSASESKTTQSNKADSSASKKTDVVANNSQPKTQAQPSMKAYEFKSSVDLGSVVGDSTKINTSGSSSQVKLNEASFNAGKSSGGSLVAGTQIGVSKLNGQENGGNGVDYGSRGLASKKAFETSAIETRTVVMGSMDPELLRKILREYIPQFRHCYQQELIGQSDKIKGIIDLNFTIGPQGKVATHQIKAKDARFSQKGIGCMGQVLSLIDFPRPKGGGMVDVKQPLNFFAETEKI